MRSKLVAVAAILWLPLMFVSTQAFRPTSKVVYGANDSRLTIAWENHYASTGRSVNRRIDLPGLARLDVTVDSEHSVYLLDKFIDKSSGKRGFIVRKYNASGKVEWTANEVVRPPFKIEPRAVGIDDRGHAWVVSTAFLSHQGAGISMHKFSRRGHRLTFSFIRREPIPYTTTAFMLAADGRGGMYAAGAVRQPKRFNWGSAEVPWLARYGPDGNLVWERRPIPANSRGAATAISAGPRGAVLSAAGDTVLTTQLVGDSRFIDNWAYYEARIAFNSKGREVSSRVRKIPPAGSLRAVKPASWKGFEYRVTAAGPDLWLEIVKHRSTVLRAALAHAKEGSDTGFFEAAKLVKGATQGRSQDVYLLAVEKRRKSLYPIVHLYSLEVSLP